MRHACLIKCTFVIMEEFIRCTKLFDEGMFHSFGMAFNYLHMRFGPKIVNSH